MARQIAGCHWQGAEIEVSIRPAGLPEPDPFTGGEDASPKPQIPGDRPTKPALV